MDVFSRGMKMDLAAMRVNASEGFLQYAEIVCAVFEVLRSSAKLNALEMRSSFSAFWSRVRVACAYCVARVASTTRAREEMKSRPGRAAVMMPELLSCMSIETWTVLVSHSV